MSEITDRDSNAEYKILLTVLHFLIIKAKAHLSKIILEILIELNLNNHRCFQLESQQRITLAKVL